MSDDPPELRGAQRRIAEAYAAHESGLFTLNCVAGAGKSFAIHRIGACDVIRRYANGDPTPERRLAIVSFNTDEADDIAPSVAAHVRTVAEHDLIPEAEALSDAEVEHLVARVRRAPRFGTVDALLRDAFGEFATAVGFDAMPDVGNAAALTHLHRECYEAVAAECPAAVERLEAAYPDGEHDATAPDLLKAALDHCRDRRLSTERFREELLASRDAVYPTGRPESFDDALAAVEAFVDAETAASVDDEVSDADRDRVADADARLYAAWTECIDAFADALRAYREEYRTRVREAGVVSHTDVAYLVDRYLAGDVPGYEVDPDHRVRVRERYRVESVLVDEAQDVSVSQHDALAHLVDADVRVCVAGDALQSIYGWRNAAPSLFTTACEEGRYFGVDWGTHVGETATATYRSTPDVAGAVNRICEPVFADPQRGAIGESGVTFDRLDPVREVTSDERVHVASFSSVRRPGTEGWANPDGDRNGAANALATYVASGLADGTFTDADGDPLSVTVLFRKGTLTDEYEAAFEAEGLSVWNAGGDLFESPAVERVLDVCDWLVAPEDPERTRRLLAALGLDGLADGDAPLDDPTPADASDDLLAALRRLRDERDRFGVEPAGVWIADVIDALGLRADAFDLLADLDGDRRVADLDGFVATVRDWEGEDRLDPREFVELVAPFRDDPSQGPDRPATSTTDHDVTFRTVHRAKGDEDGVVIPADIGTSIHFPGAFQSRLLTRAGVVALAPPTDVDVPTDVALGPYEAGLYAPDGDGNRDVGLRWATALWADEVGETADPRPVGPERLNRVVRAERAEEWRILYVALTRARDHLLLPLPDEVPGRDRTRDRWLDGVHDALAYDGSGRGQYTLSDPDGREFTVAVNGIDFLASRPRPPDPDPPLAAVAPPSLEALPDWRPRFLDPSTAYPLLGDPEGNVVPHLLDEAIHTETGSVPDDLPLPFDAFGPDAVGTCLHDALTRLVERGVDPGVIRAMDDPVHVAIDEAIEATASEYVTVGAPERDALVAFFADYVREPFLASELYERIRAAETVYVEHDVDGLVTADGSEVEIHGTVDFLLDMGDGEWCVTDAKISLTDAVADTRRRYRLQVAAYAYLLARELPAGTTVRRSVETFGVARDTVGGDAPPEAFVRRVRRLME